MESALIVTTACKGTQLLAELLKMSGITSISTAASGGDARRLCWRLALTWWSSMLH